MKNFFFIDTYDIVIALLNKDEIHKLWKQDAKTDGEDHRLQKDDLRRQLDMKQSALETKDIELNSVRNVCRQFCMLL
jgi:hypothetical protein